MNPGMPKGEAPKLYLGAHALLVFKKEGERGILGLMRCFSSTTRFAYNRLLKGKTRGEFKQEGGPLCLLSGLNTRHADEATEKAQNAAPYHEAWMGQIGVKRRKEENSYLKRRWSRDLRKIQLVLASFSSLQGSPGGQWKSTDGRNFPGANPRQVLRVGFFLPLLGLVVSRDLSSLDPIPHLTPLAQGSWRGWKTGLGPYPGEGPGCANVHFC